VQGHRGSITLVGDEPLLPYARPPLSKGWLVGEVAREQLLIRPSSTYADQRIDWMHARAVALDRGTGQVQLEEGGRLAYDHLVLATGGRARRLPHAVLAGASNVHHLKTLDDACRLRAQLGRARRLVIIGGGYVGLEVAASARRQDMQVTLLEAQPRVLSRVAGEPLSRFFERVHREQGVDLRLQVRIEGFECGAQGRIDAVRLDSGERLPCDAVLVGIGQHANDELAAEAGLAVNDGILVDHGGRTADARVFAIGDCCRRSRAPDGPALRLESVDNALQQARLVAATITGRAAPAASPPWFWSNQYDLRLQTVGLWTGCDQLVVRGDPGSGRNLSVFYLRDGVVRAADVVSNPREFAMARKLVTAEARVNPTQLADPSVPLNAGIAVPTPTA
jgi:3-phenylpropionate/trans-cinnamate dioxygenase ferredoxin reductase subunit